MAAVALKFPRVWPLLLPLLWLCVPPSDTGNSRVSADDDLLLPYAQGHGPSHSHRHVRDCQPIIHGNTTHESWPGGDHGGPPVAESTVFVADVPRSSRFVYGHMTLVHDPLRTVSVLEPGGPGGCGMNQRATVQETATAAGCLYALNAGFFNTGTGRCLGNVVSDGRTVQDGGGVQNVQFGIRRNGTLVFGFLSEEDVSEASNPFVQLVSGVVWLLRDGEVYVNQSLKAECDDMQETGLRYFVESVSARSVVGHDAQGRLVLVQFEGQTGVRGVSLWEAAEFLKKNGVVNAVNLDGGGSSTFIINGSLASYPSDHCKPDSRWRCGRPVSTILCVHPRRCEPGAACDALRCRPPDCGPHGVCVDNGCVCDAGWRGTNCSRECLPGFYGDGCSRTCVCANGGSCDPVHGRCICPPGFCGNTCEAACPLGFFGASCAHECLCDHRCPCDPQTGSCNGTLPRETYDTLQKAGQCLARQMFTTWRREEEAHRERPYLTERTWLTLAVTLTCLLTASLLVHLVQAWRRHGPERRDYSYVPLSDIHAEGSHGAEPGAGAPGKGGFVMDDPDSQDETWSPSCSGGSEL